MYVCIQLMYLYRLLAHFVQLVNFRPLLTGSVSMYYVFIGCNEVDPLRSIAFLSKPSCYISFVVLLGYYESQVKCSNKLTPKRVDLFQHPNS